MEQLEPRFYVYVLARPDGRPFYVGKGKGSRIYQHDSEARSGHRCPKCNTIRKIWRAGGEVQRYIVFQTDDEQEAFDREREYIALYGRANLCNLTDGGDGYTTADNAWSTPERRESMLARKKDPAYREKLRNASVMAGEQISERGKQLWKDPAYRQRMEAVHKSTFPDMWADPEKKKEVSRKIGIAHKGRPKSEEHRAKIAAGVKAAHKARKPQEAG